MQSEQATRIWRVLVGVLLVLGVLLCGLALGADVLGLDRTPGFGLLQMSELLVGVTFLTLAAFLVLRRRRGTAPRSLQADIGIRLVGTGLVFMYVAGFSDIIRIGTHIQPRFERPFVGPLQFGGLLLGLVVIIAGFLLYQTSRGRRASSSMEFIVNGNGNGNSNQ